MADNSSKFIDDLSQIGNSILQGGRTLASFNEARERGNLGTPDNEILQDYSNLAPSDFQLKYGTDTLHLMEQGQIGVDALNEYKLGADRTNSQVITDNLRSISRGFTNTVGNIPTPFLGPLGISAADALQRYDEFRQENDSQYLRRNRELDSIRTELDKIDNQAQYDQEVADGQSFSGARHFLREMRDTGSRIIENPAMAEEIVGQGIGSLLTVAPLARILGMAGLTTRTSAATSIGLMEGGGAYAGTVQEVMGMSHEDLLDSSPDYRSMVEEGMDPKSAQERIAHHAGIISGMIQGPAGAATGRMVAGFEAAPFASRGAGQIARNILLEGAEESTQGVTGQLAQNLAIGMQADPARQLTEDVASGLVEGAVGGVGAAGAVQGAGLPGRAARGAVRAAGKAANRRIERIIEEQEKGNPISRANTNTAFKEAMNVAPALSEKIQTAAEENSLPETAQNQALEYAQKIASSVLMSADDVNAMPENIREDMSKAIVDKYEGQPNKFELLNEAAGMLLNEQTAVEKRVSAGVFLARMLENHKKLVEEDLPEFLDNITEDNPLYEEVQHFAQIVSVINNNQDIRKALNWVREGMQQPERDMNSLAPEQAQEVATETAEIASLAPQAINEEVAEGVLNQADDGTLSLTPDQRRSIRAAMSLKNAQRVRQAAMRLMEPEVVQSQVQELEQELSDTQTQDAQDSIDFVNKAIRIEGNKLAHRMSLRDHVKGINDAVLAGNTQEATERLQTLRLFAQSHGNKVQAFNQAIRNNNRERVPYSALGSDGKMLPADGYFSVYFNPGKGREASVRMARTVNAEAQAIAGLANQMAENYPELGVPPIEVPTLVLDPVNTQPQSQPQELVEGDPIPADITALQATTSEAPVIEQETESPSPSSQPVRKPEAPVLTDQTGTTDSTGQTGKKKASSASTENDTVRQIPYPELNRRIDFLQNKVESGKATDKAKHVLEFLTQEKSRREAEEPNSIAWEVIQEDAVKAYKGSDPDQVRAINSRLDGLPDEQVTELVANLNKNIIDPADVSEEYEAQVDAAFSELSQYIDKTLFPQIFRGLYHVDFKKGFEHLYAHANYLTQTIFLSGSMADRLSTGDTSPESLRRLIAHEVGHLVDHAGGVLLDKSMTFSQIEENGFGEDGVIWKELEAINQLDIDPKLKPKLTYILSKKSKQERFNETFAETFSIVAVLPEIAREHLPEGTRLIEDVLNRLAERQGIKRQPRASIGYDGLPGSTGTEEVDATLEVLNQESETRAGREEPTEERSPDPVQETEDSDTEIYFPSLVRTADGVNYFHQSYDMPQQPRSRLYKMLSPLRDLFVALETNKSLENLIGEPVDHITATQRANLQSLMELGNAVKQHVNSRLQHALERPQNKQPSYLQQFEDGKSILHYPELRAFNLTEKTDDGYRYNEQLLDGAILASLDWLLNRGEFMGVQDKLSVAQALSVDESQVDDSWVTAFNRGPTINSSIASLTQFIMNYWGVTQRPDVSPQYSIGIAEAIAKEILHGMNSARNPENPKQSWALLELKNKDGFTGKDNRVMLEGLATNKTPNFIHFHTRHESLTNFLNEVRKTPDLLTDLLLVQRDVEGVSVDRPVEEVDRRQLRNPSVRNTNPQLKALENAQKAEYKVNPPLFDFISEIGEEDFISTQVGHPYKKGDISKTHEQMGLNIGHWKSLQGRMLTWYNSFHKTQLVMEQVKAALEAQTELARKEGKPLPALEDINSFIKHHINRVGRPQMGGHNPQTDKFVREVLLPTRATIDLTTPGSRDHDNFLKAIGQGIGLKTELLTGDVIADEVMKQVFTKGGKYHRFVRDLKEWMIRKENNPKVIIRKDVRERFKKLMHNQELSLHGFHGLMAAAQYLKAQEQGQDLSKFQTQLYFEADGKTNGVLNSLMLFTTQITDGWIQSIRKGGVFFNQLGQSLNRSPDKEDLYLSAAKAANEAIGILRDSLKDNQPVLHHMKYFYNTLSALNINFQFDGDNLIIERNGIKNPMTITVYGSGIKGMSEKIADEIFMTLYENISEANEKNISLAELLQVDEKTFYHDLAQVLGKFPSLTKDGWILKGKANALPSLNLNFERSDYQYLSLAQNVRNFLTEPMREGISEVAGKHVEETLQTIQKATDTQSIVAKHLFVRELINRLAHKRAAGEKEFLTNRELEDVRKHVLQHIPPIHTGSQVYLLSGGERTPVFRSEKVRIGEETFNVAAPSTFSRSLSGDLFTDPYIDGFSTAGLKAIATMAIGSGDGQAMINALSENPDFARRVVHVFDGMNLPIDLIEEGSTLMNKAVFQSWTTNGNPVRAVAESIQATVRTNPFEKLFSDRDNPTNNDLAALQELTGLDKEAFDESLQEIGFKALASSVEETFLIQSHALNEMADRTDAIRQAIQEFDLSVDQMAGGESPYVHEGTRKLPANASDAEIAHAIQQRVDEIIYLKSDQKKKDSIVQAPVAEVQEVLRENLDLDDSGALVADRLDIVPLVRKLSKFFNKSDRALLNNAAELLSHSEYRIVFGTEQELDIWEQTYHGDRYRPGGNGKYGKIDTIGKFITIRNLAPETILHELLHASTFSQLDTYFSNPDSLSKETREAIERIESLQDEWLVQSFAVEEDMPILAREAAESAIARHRQQGNHAAALSEFISWVLSNQHLARVASQTTVLGRIGQITKDALDYIRTLFWGSADRGPRPGTDMLSNLRFNTQIIIKDPSSIDLLQQDAAETIMHQSPTFGTSDRLSNMRKKLHDRLVSWIGEGTPVQQLQRAPEVRKAMLDARRIGGVFAQHFPGLGNMQAQSTFRSLLSVLMTEADLNTNSLSRMQDLYAHVMDNLTVEDLMADPQSQDPNDRHQAQNQFDVLSGLYINMKDQHERSTLMASFLALAMTDDGFRETLSNMPIPKTEKNQDGTLDALLENVGYRFADQLSQLVSGEGRSTNNIRNALDHLTAAMIENTGDQRSHIETGLDNGLNGVDRYLKTAIESGADRLRKKAEKISDNTRNKAIERAAKAVEAGASLFDPTITEKLMRDTVSLFNKDQSANPFRRLTNRIISPETQRAIVNDLLGRTKDNAGVFDMISKVRHMVSQTRQHYKETLPHEFRKQFTRKLTSTDEANMYHTMIRTDLAALVEPANVSVAVDYITDGNKRAGEIKRLENAINKAVPRHGSLMLQKAVQLSNYMNTGEYGQHLLRNANAIAGLYGLPGAMMKGQKPDPELVRNIDRLVSLYAIRDMNQDTRDSFVELVQTERKGVEFILGYMTYLREEEMKKINSSNMAINNHFKGHIPKTQTNEGSLIIADDLYHDDLVRQGYVRSHAYGGSNVDHTLGSRSYYYSPINGLATFQQGVMQTVQQTAGGVDPATGFMKHEVTGGRITNPRDIARIRQRMSRAAATSEPLVPVINSDGSIIAYERAADPAQLASLRYNNRITEALGTWNGRQVEENISKEVNNELINNLYETYQQDLKAKRGGEYVDLFNSNDPVIQDAVRLIPDDTREHIESLFGSNRFWVRKDLIKDAIGERSASIGDAFTGKARWDPRTMKTIEKAALLMFDKDAFRYLVQAEKGIQNLIADAKMLIVVRSVIVPAFNMASNFLHLLNRGVPLRDVLRGSAGKTAELNDYIRRRDQEIGLEAELRAAEGRDDIRAMRRLNNQLTAIRDSYKRMSIWPLINAGLFSVISDGQPTNEDLALAKGKWKEHLFSYVNKMHSVPRTAVRYGMMTRDTALYQGLARSVQYGDFIAKAILYDDLMKRQNRSQEEAVAEVNDAFIDYNRLAGRSRHYLESVGLLWFYNFKLRIMKESAWTLRNRPLRSLMALWLAPVGIPLTDNIFSSYLDDRLPFSIGPGMGFRSVDLHPMNHILP